MPELTPFQALNAFLLTWGIVAYLAAAVAGFRALNVAWAHPPAPPACLIVDATRWLFGLRMSDRNWRPRDFVAFGVFGATLACMCFAAINIGFLRDVLSIPYQTHEVTYRAMSHVISGSAIILIHCGLALRFKRDHKAGGV